MIEEKLEAAADKELLSRAFSLIKKGESISAREILDEILAEFPECAEAHLGLLMLEVGVNEREELHSDNTPFNSCAHYKNALKYADDELRLFLTEIRTNPYIPDGEAWVNKYKLQLHDLGAYYEVTAGFPENGVIKIPPYYNLKPIRAIAEGAFANTEEIERLITFGLLNPNLKNAFTVELPATIRKIGDRAFAGSRIARINLPDGLLEIGESAFADCRELKQISFPINPVKLCTNAFANDVPLERVNIKSLAAWCENDVAPEGACPFWVSDAVICINDEPIRELVIPEEVTEIKDNTFLHISSITSLKLPSSLRRIGASSFGLSRNIESISFGDGLLEIGEYAFFGCEELRAVSLPHTMKKIGAKAFLNCKRIESLSLGGTEEIGNEAFHGCDALSSLTIPACVKHIGRECFKSTHIKSLTTEGMLDLIDKGAFQYCEELEEFSFSGAKTIGDSAFSFCKRIKNVVIPVGTEIIGGSAFYGCSSIEMLMLPDTISEIGGSAFSETGTSKKIYINGLESWCSIKFADMNANPIYSSSEVLIDGARVEKLTIPDGIGEIKAYAFAGMSSLCEVVFPKSLTKIGECAFYACPTLTSIRIPRTISSIGRYAFIRTAEMPEKTIIIEKGARGIHTEAFSSMYAPEKNRVFYEGAKRDLSSVIVNGKLLARCDVYYYSNEKKFLGGKMWRYVGDEPTPW